MSLNILCSHAPRQDKYKGQKVHEKRASKSSNRHQPSLLLQRQKSRNHGDDSLAACYFVTRVAV